MYAMSPGEVAVVDSQKNTVSFSVPAGQDSMGNQRWRIKFATTAFRSRRKVKRWLAEVAPMVRVSVDGT